MTDARITLDAAALKARIATLEAELAASRTDATLAWAEAKLIGEDEDAANLNAANWQAHANALRDALEELRGVCDGQVAGEPLCADKYPTYRCGTCQDNAVIDAAILATPAASLATAKDSLRSHDAEVLERAACICDEARAVAAGRTGDPSTIKGAMYEVVECVAAECADRIRALAAQAATHSELEVKP